MKIKHSVVRSRLPILILAGLFLLRGYAMSVNLYINHFMEGLIVLTLLAFGANMIVDILKKSLITGARLFSFFQSKSYIVETKKAHRPLECSRISHVNFNRLTAIQK